MDIMNAIVNEYLYSLSEGNAGAISVMASISKNYEAECFDIYEKMSKHDIRGSDMWVLFKRFDKDIEKFVEYIKTLN